MADTLVVNEIYLSLQGESTFAGLPCVFVRLTACNLRCSYCDTAYAFTAGRRQPLSEVLAEVRRLAAPFAARCLPTSDGWGETPSSRAQPEAQKESRVREDFRPAVESRAGGATLRGAQQSPVGSQGSTESRPTTEALARLSEIQNPKSGPPLPGRLPLVELTGGEPLLQPGALPLMKALCDDGFTVLVETSGALDIAPVDPRVRRIMDLKCPSSGEAARNRWENLRHLKPTDEVKFVIGTVEDYEWARRVIAERGLAAVCPLLFSWVAPLAPHQQDKSLKAVPPGQTPLSRRELAERIIADALPVRFQVQMHKVIWPPDQRGV